MQALELGRPPEVAICLDGVSKAYKLYDRPFNFFKEALTGRSYHRDKVVLSDISLTLRRGEILGIIGRNGAGKSTLLKIIAGTLAPSQGAVTVKGRVAAILELGTGFNPNYSGRDNVILSALMRGMSEDAVRRKFDGIVAFAGLEDVIDEPFHTYSSGMQARLAFAAATAVDADILIIDEALSSGDLRFAARSLRRIREICQSGVTALFVSHVPYHVMQLCSRVIWIDDGRIRMDGNPIEVARAYEYEMLQAVARDEGRVLTGPSAVIATQEIETSTSAPHQAPPPAPHRPLKAVSTDAPIVPAPDVGGVIKAEPDAPATQPSNIEAIDPIEENVGAEAAGDTIQVSTGGVVEASAVDQDSVNDVSVDEPLVNGSKIQERSERASIRRVSTGLYRISKVQFSDKSGRHTNIFKFGEPMQIEVFYERLAPEHAGQSCGLAVTFSRVDDFAAVMHFNTNDGYSNEQIRSYFNKALENRLIRAGTIEAIIEPLQIRAGEYYVSIGILPDQAEAQEFYDYLHCHYRIKVLANGFDEPCVFYPVVQWTNGPIKVVK
jgi:ABC-type polysaccharide/polyol phosphate transport system ATPase subunit